MQMVTWMRRHEYSAIETASRIVADAKRIRMDAISFPLGNAEDRPRTWLDRICQKKGMLAISILGVSNFGEQQIDSSEVIVAKSWVLRRVAGN
jgi:hypothetical protein